MRALLFALSIGACTPQPSPVAVPAEPAARRVEHRTDLQERILASGYEGTFVASDGDTLTIAEPAGSALIADTAFNASPRA